MSVQFRAASKQSYSGANKTSYTVSKPTGTLDGDLMVMFWAASNTVVPSTLSGWTPLRNDNYNGAANNNSIFWKIASGEGASYTWTSGGTRANQQILSFYNTNGFDGQSFSDNALSTNMTATTVTIAEGDEVLIWYGAYANEPAARTITLPGGYTDPGVFATNDNSTVFGGAGIAYLLNPATGATGSVIGTISNSSVSGCYLISIKAAASNNYSLLLASL